MLRNKALLLAGKIKITWGKILANVVSCPNNVYLHEERKEEREREREREIEREEEIVLGCYSRVTYYPW